MRISRIAAHRLVAAALCVHAGLLAWGAYRQSPSACEVPQLPAGISHWLTGGFELYRVNPPLVRMIAAVPIFAVGANTNWAQFQGGPGDRPEFPVGDDFVKANGARSFWLYTLARWACIPFSLLGGYFCWRWARDLYGVCAGLLSLGLWCFSPDIIAHGQLITTDAAASAFAVGSAYYFWKWLKQPTWKWAMIAGIALGLAQLAKMTLLIFFGLWPVIWFVYRMISPAPQPFQSTKRVQAVQLVFMQFVGLFILNAGYCFDGTCERLGDYHFVSKSLSGTQSKAYGNRFETSALRWIPLPLPNCYVRGLDEQKKDFEKFTIPSYLRGEFRSKGWWYFYLYGMLVKTPVCVLLMLVAAVMTLFTNTRDTKCGDLFALLAPAIALLALVSSQSGFSVHYRYVLPVFPFLFVFIGRLAHVASRHSHYASALLLAGLVGAVSSTLASYPHTLSYFHELAGGPLKGHFHLVYSAQDWGQDLLFLRQWVSTHPECQPLKLSFYGQFDPIVAGLPQSPIPFRQAIAGTRRGDSLLEPGWYAISTSYLRGVPFPSPQGAFTYFQQLEPVAFAGYSIYIYHVSETDVQRIAAALQR